MSYFVKVTQMAWHQLISLSRMFIMWAALGQYYQRNVRKRQ